MIRLTIRGRLTLWYAAVFAGTGAAVLAVMYLLVRREFFVASHAVVADLTDGRRPSRRSTPRRGQSAAGQHDRGGHDRRPHRRAAAIVVETGGVFAVLAAVSLALCWLVAGRALRPLRQITDTAAALSHDTMDARIGLRGPRDEVRTLADTFDAMLDRLARAFQGSGCSSPTPPTSCVRR
jgi:HAMP domain-containing protein